MAERNAPAARAPALNQSTPTPQLPTAIGGWTKMGDVVPMPERATFEDFWRLCYRKVDKALARSKWTAITSERGLET